MYFQIGIALISSHIPCCALMTLRKDSRLLFRSQILLHQNAGLASQIIMSRSLVAGSGVTKYQQT